MPALHVLPGLDSVSSWPAWWLRLGDVIQLGRVETVTFIGADDERDSEIFQRPQTGSPLEQLWPFFWLLPLVFSCWK
jgi:hypothetical protein